MTEAARSYLDFNATAPLHAEAAEAFARALALMGNPSSVHTEGRAARAAIERARDQVAALVGASARDVVFTSGGTEACTLALSGGFRRADDRRADAVLLTSAVEHVCVLEGHRFPAEAVVRIGVDGQGRIDLAALSEALAAIPDTTRIVLALQVANNETGVLQPLAQSASLVRGRGGLVFADAVQAAGRITFDIAASRADAIALSAHKIGGPKGVGALILASDAYAIDSPVKGGGQERGRRAGTENVAGIVAFGAAAEAARRDLIDAARRMKVMRDTIEGEIRRLSPEAVLFSSDADRLPNTVSFAAPGLKAETALISFDLAGVAVSSGSACSSGKVRRSHVLAAMGVDPSLAEGAIRVSVGSQTTENDVIRFAAAYEKALAALSSRKARAA
jgi:cysteine desulfurase